MQGTPGFCEQEPLQHLYDYKTPDAPTEKKRFHRPRGVDVQPFVTFSSPRFGDYIGPGAGVDIIWRDSRITKVGFAFYELDLTTGDFTFRGETNEINLSNRLRASRTFRRTLGSLYMEATGGVPVDRRVYKIEARICSPNETCRRPQ